MSPRSRSLPARWRGPAPDDSGQSHSIFLRGLSLGALIGAAIAGSAIWERRRSHRAEAKPEAAPGPAPSAAEPSE